MEKNALAIDLNSYLLSKTRAVGITARLPSQNELI